MADLAQALDQSYRLYVRVGPLLLAEPSSPAMNRLGH
jgi:hypothetical protein